MTEIPKTKRVNSIEEHVFQELLYDVQTNQGWLMSTSPLSHDCCTMVIHFGNTFACCFLLLVFFLLVFLFLFLRGISSTFDGPFPVVFIFYILNNIFMDRIYMYETVNPDVVLITRAVRMLLICKQMFIGNSFGVMFLSLLYKIFVAWLGLIYTYFAYDQRIHFYGISMADWTLIARFVQWSLEAYLSYGQTTHGTHFEVWDTNGKQ